MLMPLPPYILIRPLASGSRIVFARTFNETDSDSHTTPNHKPSSLMMQSLAVYVSLCITICMFCACVYLSSPAYSYANARYMSLFGAYM